MNSIFLISSEQALVYLPLIVGAYISTSLMKVPDLSLESSFTFGAITGYCALLLFQGAPQAVTLLAVLVAALVGGMCVGIVASNLTERFGFPHLLSSIVTIGLFHGINQLVLGTSNASLYKLGNPFKIVLSTFELPEYGVFFIVSFVVMASLFFLLKTQLGYAFAIYGRNKNFFVYHRSDRGFIFITGLMISNGLAGISGYLCAQSAGFVDTTMGLGIPLLAITALILGKTIIRKKEMNPLIPLVGAGIYFFVQQLLLKIGFNLKFFTAVQAGIVLLILAYHYSGSAEKKIDHLGV